MTALVERYAEALAALVPLAIVGDLAARGMLAPINHEHTTAARDVLRKTAPCAECKGGGSRRPTDPAISVLGALCPACCGDGFTPGSLEAHIAEEAEPVQFD